MSVTFSKRTRGACSGSAADCDQHRAPQPEPASEPNSRQSSSEGPRGCRRRELTDECLAVAEIEKIEIVEQKKDKLAHIKQRRRELKDEKLPSQPLPQPPPSHSLNKRRQKC